MRRIPGEPAKRDRPALTQARSDRSAETIELMRGLGRAFGGAVLFALPIFMTMEVWALALSIPNHRVGLLVAVTVATAFVLARYLGIRDTPPRWRDAGVDAAIALFVGFLAATVVLSLLSVIEPTLRWRDAVSVVAVQALPATIGAALARAQLAEARRPARHERSYLHEMFLMAAGAVVLAANIAPTEEVVLIAAKMSDEEALLLVGFEIALMHGFVYSVGFRGGSHDAGFWAPFTRFTLVGYAIALLVSGYVLWSLGRFDGTGLLPIVVQTVVLALPASIGAAAARLIL